MVEPSQPDAAAPAPGDRANEPIDVLGLARYTVPLHAALPLLLWWLVAIDARAVLEVGFFAIHLGFPVVLVVTYPLWEGKGAHVALLLVLNHIVTFVMGGLLALAVAA